jgi:hypothetical protein
MKRRGQSTLEYALIIAVVLGALLAMNHYMRRGVEGKLRSSADSIGDQFSAGKTTYKVTTEQLQPETTVETFGLAVDANGASTSTPVKGVSGYHVDSAGEKQVSATDDAKEKTDTKFSDEKIFDQ